MGISSFIGDVFEKVGDIAEHVQTRIETNKTCKKLRKDVEASVARAVQAGRSPYEEMFRDASLQEVLAMSVDSVYYRDHSGMDLKYFVKPLVEGEYEVDERMAHFTSNLYWTRLESISEQEEKDARIKHYVRRPGNPCASAPKLIIAIRGTKLSSVHDLVDDVRISATTIGFAGRLKQGLDLVKKIIQEYKKWQQEDDADYSQVDGSETDIDKRLVLSTLVPDRVEHLGYQCDVCSTYPIFGIRYSSIRNQNYDLCQECFQEHGALKDYTKIEKPKATLCRDIYITGHSLGAALALQIGKKLAAEESQRYNVHCFNPPFLTIVQLIQEKTRISKAKRMLRKSPLEPLINAASHGKSVTKALAVMILNKEQLRTEVVHFLTLTDWVPVMYINARDDICRRFKKHYKLKQKASAGFEVDSQALVSQVLGHRAVFSSLVPSVDMRISKLSVNSHAVKNWYRSPTIDQFRQYRLLPGVAAELLISIDEFVKGFLHGLLHPPDSAQEEDAILEEAYLEEDANLEDALEDICLDDDTLFSTTETELVT